MKSSDRMRGRSVSRAIINILAKGDIAAQKLLMAIHQSVPNDIKTMSCPAERVRYEIVMDKLQSRITW